MLYPLKFAPIYKQILWGGKNISSYFHRDIPMDQVAESWELCCRDEGTSVVSCGALKGMTLQGVILTYREKLLGDKVYQKFGVSFPLLIKIIDASENLSVQVHPDDAYARDNGEKNGKNELWYVLDAQENSRLVYGIKKNVSKDDFIKAVSKNKTEQTLNVVSAKPGDVFYVPAGKVHAILGGLLIAEIQQNSNTTFRIYDWGRVDKNGKGRALNTSKALDVIDFQSGNQQESYSQTLNKKNYRTNAILRSDFFNVDKISVHNRYIGTAKGSFIIMMCIQGNGEILCENGTCKIKFGETVLLPACLGKFTIYGSITLLAIFM